MTVLTFFILISMTLALEQGVEVQLPSQQATDPRQPPPPPMIVELDLQGVSLNAKPIATAPLMQQVKAYLAKNPKGAVVLKAEPQLPYADVVKLLTELKATGGERVSLAIE